MTRRGWSLVSLAGLLAVCAVACWQAGRAGHEVWSGLFAVAGAVPAVGIGLVWAGREGART